MKISTFEQIKERYNLSPVSPSNISRFRDSLEFQIKINKVELLLDIPDYRNAKKILDRLWSSDKYSYLYCRGQILNVYTNMVSQQGDFRKCGELSEKFIELTSKVSNNAIKGLACNKMAYSYIYLGNLELAQKFYQKGLEYADHSKKSMEEYTARSGLAYIKNVLGKKNEAIREMKQLEKDFGSKVGIKNRIYLYENLGSIYREVFDFRNAKKYLKKSLKLADQVKNYYIMIYSNYNLASIYFHKEDWERAYQIYNRGLECAKKVGDHRGLVLGYFSISLIFSKTNRLKKAENWMTKALKIVNRTGSTPLVLRCKLRLADLYIDLKKDDQLKKLFSEIKAILKAQPGFAREELELQYLETRLHFKRSRFKQAIKYGKAAKSLAKKIEASEFLKKINELICRAQKQISK